MTAEKMTAGEVVEQLQELKLHCESMTEGDDNWERDIAALTCAITVFGCWASEKGLE